MADRGDPPAVAVLSAPALNGVPHGFLGRIGGVSTGAVAGLNVGLGGPDGDMAAAQNRVRAVAAVAPGAQLVTVRQVHSPLCVTAIDPWDAGSRPEADALVTNRPGLVLGIVTADCAPVLFVDRAAGVIGAAHAGWKGALGGVTDQTLAAMEALGAHRSTIAAAIGPCIAQASYEVDAAFRDSFLATDAQNTAHFVPGEGDRWQFDLEGYVAMRLESAGIGQVERLGQDTYSQPDRFFSFRRATHHGEANYGRQFSLVALP